MSPPMTPKLRYNIINLSSSSGYAGSPAPYRGRWWVDHHEATLSILQNRFCESSIRFLAFASSNILAQYKVQHKVRQEGNEVIACLTNEDAVEVYRLGYALLLHHIPRNDPHVDEYALGKQSTMLAALVENEEEEEKFERQGDGFLAKLWEPASVEWMAMILRATHPMM